jgi:hypothetical protein
MMGYGLGGSFTLGPWHVRRAGYGAMQLAGDGVFGPPRERDEALRVLPAAVEAGVDHVDTAQFYGAGTVNELIREALHPYPDALDALHDGYEVYPVVDAIAGTSPEAHRAGLERVTQAGGQPVSWVSLACELQRDWARVETVPAIVDIVLTDRLTKE